MSTPATPALDAMVRSLALFTMQEAARILRAKGIVDVCGVLILDGSRIDAEEIAEHLRAATRANIDRLLDDIKTLAETGQSGWISVAVHTAARDNAQAGVTAFLEKFNARRRSALVN